MPRKLGVPVFVLALVLAAGAVHAQGQKDVKPAAAPPPAPVMSAEGRRFIDGWLGQWTCNDASYTAGGQKMQGSLKITCESASSGWAALCKGTFVMAGMPPSASTFLMGWDLGTREAHMFEVADTGEVHDHSGKWADDKSVSLVRQGRTVDGKLEKDACTATWVSARELKFDCAGSQAGATVWTFSSTNRK